MNFSPTKICGIVLKPVSDSSFFQVASVVGPSLAGLVIATLGVGWVYAFNAASFVAVIVALLMMRGVVEPAAHERSQVSLKAAADNDAEDEPDVAALRTTATS